jgi:hypothetical protein
MKQIFILFALLLTVAGYSQEYGMPLALGIRLSPDGVGVTGKVFIGPYWAVDIQANGSDGFTWWSEKTADGDSRSLPVDNTDIGPSWTVSSLLEHNIIFNNVSWRIYGGAGFHFGKWDRYNHRYDERKPKPEGIFGFDGVVGGEYLFKTLPLGISAEVKPAINCFNDDFVFFPNNLFGLSIRYYFGHLVPLYYYKKGT